MSKITSATVTCTCGEEINITKYDSVNALLNPELVDKLIDGSLCETQCPKCKQNIVLVYPILFNVGMPMHPMIQFYPYEDFESFKEKNEKMISQIESSFAKMGAPFGGFLTKQPKMIYVNHYEEFVEMVKSQIDYRRR